MKQVIKKQTHYNVLVMRDDGAARTFRIHRGLLRFSIFFLVLLLLAGGGIIAAGLHFGKHYLTLRAEFSQQEKELSEMRLQLERLVNLETLLSASTTEAAPLAKHEEIGASAPQNRSQNATTGGGNGHVLSSSNATNGGNGAAPAPLASLVQTEEIPESYIKDLDTSQLPLISSNKSPVRINNFSGRPVGQQRIRIRYDLATSGQDAKMVGGLARHFALFLDGGKAELPLQDNGETRFAITRMKPMEATARLPQGYDAKDIRQIDVMIETEDGSRYHELFDVTHWRSY